MDSTTESQAETAAFMAARPLRSDLSMDARKTLSGKYQKRQVPSFPDQMAWPHFQIFHKTQV